MKLLVKLSAIYFQLQNFHLWLTFESIESKVEFISTCFFSTGTMAMRRRHDGGVWDFTIKAFPYHRRRPSRIAGPMTGVGPVAYEDMEARLSPL